MAAPIPPSLSQLINPQTAAPRPSVQPAATGGFRDAMAAQRAFFQQVTAPKVTPASYTAAEIARAAPVVNMPPAADEPQPLKRPGSFLNIVV